MDSFKDKRIKQYSYTLLTMALIMLVMMGFFSYWNACKLQEDNFTEVGDHLTEIVDKGIHDEITRLVSYANKLADSREINNFLDNPTGFMFKYRVEELIDVTKSEYQKFVSVGITPYSDVEKRIHKCFTESEQENSFIEKEYFRNHPYFIGNFKRFQNKLLLQITVPVLTDDEIIGSVCLQMDMQEFIDQYVESITFRETGYIYLISEDTDILIAPSRVIDYEKLVNNFNQIMNSRDPMPTYNDQVYFLKELVLSTDKSMTYYIVFIKDEAELYQFTNVIIANTIVVIVLFSIVILMLNYIISRRFIRLAKEENRTVVEETVDHEVKKQTQVLRKIAETDSLTQLYNHGSFFSLLEKNVRQSRKDSEPICLLMLDLDYFKEINDNYGHPIGDEVLITVARLLEENIREQDIAGRYGGEEFAVMLKGIHLDKGYAIAERIRKQVLATEFTDQQIKLTISIGIAEMDQDDVAAFIKKADKKLYASKAYGRNKTTF